MENIVSPITLSAIAAALIAAVVLQPTILNLQVSDHPVSSVTTTKKPHHISDSGAKTHDAPDHGGNPDMAPDAAHSDAILTSKTLKAAMKKVGTCGLSATSVAYIISAQGTSPAIYRPGVSAAATSVCPAINAKADKTISASAITSMWAWGNPVSPAVDARGLGQAPFAPATIAAFAATRKLTDVKLSVPWAANEGTAIRSWLVSSVNAIHAKGQTVSALGGDNSWVDAPALQAQWITAAHATAAFNGVQLDIEPWVDIPDWTTNPKAIASYVDLVQDAETTAHSLGMTLNLDAPWWLSTTPYLSGSVLTSLLPYVDSVAIVAYADHAGGSDGVIAQAWPAVVEATAATIPFSIGVQTSSNEESGGAQYTFANAGSATLEAETAKVRAAYSTTLGYTGVTVEEYLSWAALKP